MQTIIPSGSEILAVLDFRDCPCLSAFSSPKVLLRSQLEVHVAEQGDNVVVFELELESRKAWDVPLMHATFLS